MTKEFLKYKNDINKLSFKGFTKNELNLFMSVCSKVKEKGKKYNNFPQRTYDYNALEKELLNQSVPESEPDQSSDDYFQEQLKNLTVK